MSREQILKYLDFEINRDKVDYDIVQTEIFDNFKRHLIKYPGSESDEIPAYLFIPHQGIRGAILVHHQHAGERHLGKSEVAGITGDPNQFFCPELANRGFICLAPDSICFEDRRTNMTGTNPAADPDDDILQHYNEMCYRILRGTTLMKKVVDDSAIGISLLSQLRNVPRGKIGILGHSYGGNTVIFHAPFDDRIKYACSSGAVCSYANKFENYTGIEMAEVIPGFVEHFDIADLITDVCPRKFLIVAATDDKFSKDAEGIYQESIDAYVTANVAENLELRMYDGSHALNSDRFSFIVNWFDKSFD